MSAAMTLVVLIASRDAIDPATDALRTAAHAALGVDVDVLVHFVQEMPPDDVALETGRALSADAVAEVAWADADHRHAALHVHIQGANRWIDRDIGFDPADADVERGRTLGFAVAAMMPDEMRTRAPAPVEPPAATVSSADEGPARSANPHASHPSRGAIDLLAAGAAGGDATGIGGQLVVRLYLDPHWALVGSAGGRVGQDSGAQATALFLFGGPGLSWRGLPADSRFRVGARLDLLAMRESLSRTGADAQSRWLPGADLMAELSGQVTRGAALMLAAGGEGAFGTTDVFVRGQKVSTIPLLRLVASAGVELVF
jgi:hypothetical protein